MRDARRALVHLVYTRDRAGYAGPGNRAEAAGSPHRAGVVYLVLYILSSNILARRGITREFTSTGEPRTLRKLLLRIKLLCVLPWNLRDSYSTGCYMFRFYCAILIGWSL